jgi:hypothetical protein
VRAKFRVQSYTQYTGSGRQFTLGAVTDDGTPENERYNKATPAGTMSITIDNPAVVSFLEPGKDYYLDFTKAE